MTEKVFSIDTEPGIQRDGTYFDKNFYSDGQWVRFQRGRPRKMLGYRSITNSLKGISRGLYVNSEDGLNKIYNGHSDGIQTLNVDNNGIGAGITDFTFGGQITALDGTSLVGGSGYGPGTYTAVSLTGGSGYSATATIVVNGSGVVTSVTLVVGGQYYVVGDVLSAARADLGGGSGTEFSIAVSTVDDEFTPSDLNLWQFDTMFDSQGVGASLLLGHPGQNLQQIDSTTNTAVLAGLASGVTTPLRDTSGSAPTGDIVSVSGGVVVLHPYVFVYGDNGLIKNCSAGNPFDWNSADSNETNVAATKVVKGLPIRGGSNSPAGLFWALDSLIRVSLAPQTLGSAGTADFGATIYWKYDIISSQTSILSSQCVIEYDGLYFWIGVDRFLLYNGVVKEVPNNMNQNYFFDNLNYAAREKVYATKVPRYGEIWWFYPRGQATECTDAIVYNVRENTWYDAGQALGARRSAGYFSQVFRFPINAGTELTVEEAIFSASIDTTNASADIEMAETNLIAVNQVVNSASVPTGTTVIAIAPSVTPGNITVTLSANATATLTETASFNTQAGLTTLWQHEIGVNRVDGAEETAINSFFETSDLGWVGGGPAQTAPIGDNFWLHIERIEPDFVQSGEMYCQVIGRPYAQEDDQVSDHYVFSPTTGKIDMREQRRLGRLRFGSNVQNGNYQMGRVLINANAGDVRGY
jgi:hypothetical protein